MTFLAQDSLLAVDLDSNKLSKSSIKNGEPRLAVFMSMDGRYTENAGAIFSEYRGGRYTLRGTGAEGAGCTEAVVSYGRRVF